MKTVNLSIEGMSCQHCVRHVTQALEGVAGVQRVQVKLEDKCAELEVDEAFDSQQAAAAVQEAGYAIRV